MFNFVRAYFLESMKNASWNHCEIIDFTTCEDSRGVLTFTDNTRLPFPIRRVFWIYAIGKGQTRGGHAHRTCAEILIAVSGSFSVQVFCGTASHKFELTNPREGLLIPPMAWCELTDFTPDAVCLCLASRDYEPDGYINDFETYLKTCD